MNVDSQVTWLNDALELVAEVDEPASNEEHYATIIETA